MKDKLIILSGGMDSTTLLYQYKDDIKLAISFDYGSKHNKKEIPMAKWHCDKLNIEHIVIKLDFINDLFKSTLLQSGGDIPEGNYDDDNMRSTVVPFRNAIMLSIATGVAESRELNYVLIGNHFGDHAIYPDCRRDFIDNMEKAIFYGTYNHIELKAPYTSIDKRQIALIGKELDIDYNMTWTCYKGNDIHCGVCGSCDERKYALMGFDPTKYKE